MSNVKQVRPHVAAEANGNPLRIFGERMYTGSRSLGGKVFPLSLGQATCATDTAGDVVGLAPTERN